MASTVVAFVITSPLPMWTAITDGGWSFSAGRRAAVCIAWTAQSAADGMGTGDFPV